MKYQIIQPSPILKHYVQYFWTLEVDNFSGNAIPIRTFVDDSSGIIIEFDPSKTRITLRRAMIYGQTTNPTENNNVTSFLALGVLFYPFAIKELFGVDAGYLTNARIDVNDFFNYPLTDTVSAEKDLTSQVRILSDFLSSKIASIKYTDELIKHCIQYINSHKGLLSVKQLQEYYFISEKQLERRFNSLIGISPRHYLKITRFRKAINLIGNKNFTKLSDIAFQLNYFDQAHFIKNVKELSGLSPRKLQNHLNAGIANLII